jgi:hypothetical protein
VLDVNASAFVVINTEIDFRALWFIDRIDLLDAFAPRLELLQHLDATWAGKLAV